MTSSIYRTSQRNKSLKMSGQAQGICRRGIFLLKNPTPRLVGPVPKVQMGRAPRAGKYPGQAKGSPWCMHQGEPFARHLKYSVGTVPVFK
jgi:hypothetical protein